MANLALVYGMRMLPADDIEEVGEAQVKLIGGRSAAVTLHLIEGATQEEIRRQLNNSLDAFFELFPGV